MRASYDSALPRRKCVKIIRPTSSNWLTSGPVIDRPIVVTIHRHKGRTITCLDPSCPFCLNFWTKEERLVLPVWYGDPMHRAVLEVPVNHLERIQGFANQYHTLRGVVLHCRRANGRPNGPIEWSCFPRSEGARKKLPEWKWLEELEETWASNTQKAYCALETEKTACEDAAGCDILGRSDL